MLNHNLRASSTKLEAASKELEQKVAELKESEEKFRTIAESVHDMIFQLSPLGFIQYVSPKVKELYGYKPEDLVGRKILYSGFC